MFAFDAILHNVTFSKGAFPSSPSIVGIPFCVAHRDCVKGLSDGSSMLTIAHQEWHGVPLSLAVSPSMLSC